MRISDVCTRTKLTEKAVRFYVEKGLLKKDAKIINGRNCRDYTEEDVSILKDISILRNAGFTIQDISNMQMDNEKLADIVSKQINMLNMDTQKYLKIRDALKSLPYQSNMSWRDLARHIYTFNNSELRDITFHWPEEDVVLSPTQKKIPQICVAIIISFCIIFSLVGYFLFNTSLTTIITISDVTFYNKWIEDDKLYVQFSCSDSSPIGYDYYFFEPQILEITDSNYYETITLKNVTYGSVTLQIAMPYGIAWHYSLLNKNASPESINIEQFLCNNYFLKEYCKIIRIVA